MTYPQRVRIIDVTGMELLPGIEGKTPEDSIPHIGKEGLAEKVGRLVRITLDDGNIIWGHECWWKPLANPPEQPESVEGEGGTE